MRINKSRLFMAICTLQTLIWTHFASALFGKTELELNGITVIKDAAEILANSINTFPSKSTALAFIGLIIFSQGIFLLAKGMVNLFCSSSTTADVHRGQAQFLVGTILTVCGTLATLHSANITALLFGL